MDGIFTVSDIYKISKNQLMRMFRTTGEGDNFRAMEELRSYGETKGVVKKLSSNINSGIVGDEKDLARRMRMFGKNTRPQSKPASLLRSIQDELQNKIWWFIAVTSMIAGITNGWIVGWKEAV